MDEFFELIDLTSGNVLGDFTDADEAFAALQRTAERHGRSAIRNFSLMRIEGDRQSLVAMQDELAELVEEFERSPASRRLLTFGD